MVEAKFWQEFCERMGVNDLIPKQFYRRQEDPKGWEKMCSLVASKTQAEWLEWLKDKDICITPVKSVGDAVKDILASRSKTLDYVKFPAVGKILQTKMPLNLSLLPFSVQSATPPPELGQHTREVLEHAGFDWAEIEAWSKQGIIGNV